MNCTDSSYWNRSQHNYCYDECRCIYSEKKKREQKMHFEQCVRSGLIETAFLCALKWRKRHTRIMFKLSVPAVCFSNGFSKCTHKNIHQQQQRLPFAASGALTCVHCAYTPTQSTILFLSTKTKAHTDARHQTSPYSSHHSFTFHFTCPPLPHSLPSICSVPTTHK